jgi:hypothetical protein
VTTATTVGYGDVTPRNTAGGVIATGVMLTTIPIVPAVFALVAGRGVSSGGAWAAASPSRPFHAREMPGQRIDQPT